jgi:hypothetical protein
MGLRPACNDCGSCIQVHRRGHAQDEPRGLVNVMLLPTHMAIALLDRVAKGKVRHCMPFATHAVA